MLAGGARAAPGRTSAPQGRAWLRDSRAVLPVCADGQCAPAPGGPRAQSARSAVTGRPDVASAVPGAACDAREALALGQRYARAGLDARARAAYEKSIAMSRAPRGAFDAVKIDGLRALALAWRRVRQYDEASRCWQELLDIRGCPAAVACEATEALAIHHEHRVRDLASARSFALRTLESTKGETRRPGKDWVQAVGHRLARIDRKLGRAASVRLPELPSLLSPPSSADPMSAPRTSS